MSVIETAVEQDEATAAQAWVEGFIEGWRAPAGPESFAAHFKPMLDPEVRMIQPQLPACIGHRAFEEQFVRPLFELIPDVRGEVEHWAMRGNRLYIELTLHGHIAGRPVRFRACDRITLRDGLAVERVSYADPTQLLAPVARTPRAWGRFVRIQGRALANSLTTRRTP